MGTEQLYDYDEVRRLVREGKKMTAIGWNEAYLLWDPKNDKIKLHQKYRDPEDWYQDYTSAQMLDKRWRVVE